VGAGLTVINALSALIIGRTARRRRDAHQYASGAPMHDGHKNAHTLLVGASDRCGTAHVRLFFEFNRRRRSDSIKAFTKPDRFEYAGVDLLVDLLAADLPVLRELRHGDVFLRMCGEVHNWYTGAHGVVSLSKQKRRQSTDSTSDTIA